MYYRKKNTQTYTHENYNKVFIKYKNVKIYNFTIRLYVMYMHANIKTCTYWARRRSPAFIKRRALSC